MARQQPESSQDSAPLDRPPVPETEGSEVRDTGRDFSDLAEKLAAHTKGAPSGDLALDLILHEIVEQARLATTASGAAIALVRDGELVCRATSGASAPDLGIRLTPQSGLSGACLQTAEIQRCDDATADPRVDAEACRNLDINSILTLPLQDGTSLVGIFAIFSARPHAFGQREVQTLQAFSGRIVKSIRQAGEQAAISANSAPSLIPQPAIAGAAETVVDPPPVGVPRHDYWIDILSVAIVALTLLLGWMLGRASWNRAFPPHKQTAASSSVQPVRNATPAPIPQTSPATSATASSQAKTPGGGGNTTPSGGMVVYQNGKVIFRMTPDGVTPGRSAAHTQTPAGQTGGVTANPALPVISPEVAEAILVHRVEPEYPEEARQSGVQGDVVLQAVIGADGAVSGITPMSGESRLASAAMDAVRQWRFKPYIQNGRAIDVQTQITLKFTLP